MHPILVSLAYANSFIEDEKTITFQMRGVFNDNGSVYIDPQVSILKADLQQVLEDWPNNEEMQKQEIARSLFVD